MLHFYVFCFAIASCLVPQAWVNQNPVQPPFRQIIKAGPTVEWSMLPPNSPFRPPSPFAPPRSQMQSQRPFVAPFPPQEFRPISPPATPFRPMSPPVFQPIPPPVFQPQPAFTQPPFQPAPPTIQEQEDFNQLTPKGPAHQQHQHGHEHHPSGQQPLIPLPHGAGGNLCPDGVRVRKEFRDLTPQEWLTFKNTLIRMYNTRDEHGKSIIDRITKIHLDNGDISHYTARFLPWHRVFTWMMETEMRKFEPNITIPYWDWTYDARDPSKSPLFNDFYLGTKRGPKGDCNWRVSYPKRHCLVRNFKTLSGFYSRKSLDKIVKNHRYSYADFAEKFEVGPHGIVHTEIGGDGGDMTDMMSPNDPAFWLHHSFIELIFLEWQTLRGRNDEFGGEHLGKKAKRTDWLRPFRITIADALDHHKFCYTYQPFSRRLAPLTGSNATRALEEEAVPRVPIGKLPLSWIEMHGMTEERVREIEAELKAYEEEDDTPPTPNIQDSNASRSQPTPSPSSSKNSAFFVIALVVGAVASVLAAAILYHLCANIKV